MLNDDVKQFYKQSERVKDILLKLALVKMTIQFVKGENHT